MINFTEWRKPTYWGYHLILDLADCNDKIKSKEEIKKFLKELVKEIDMIAVGEPIIKYLLPDQPNAGFSAMQLIETSSITAHFVEPNNTAYIDVFSCKSFEPKTAIKVIKEFFDPKIVHEKFMHPGRYSAKYSPIFFRHIIALSKSW